MVVEYIRYTVPSDKASEFETGYKNAGKVLDEDEHCLSYEVSKGVEEPEHYVVRIEWDSLDGHERGFRTSPGFREFFSDVKPFFSEIEEMKHYDVKFKGSVS
jgi:heme-degrading monooxygenase HmoA